MNIFEAVTFLALEFFLRQHSAMIGPETNGEIRDRMLMYSAQVVAACEAHPIPGGWPLDACVVMADNLAKYESALWKTIHSGEKLGPGGERCLVQIHKQAMHVPVAEYKITEAEWLALVGTDAAATLRCLSWGVKFLGYHAKRCGVKYQGAWDLRGPEIIYSRYYLPNEKCIFVNGVGVKRARAYQAKLIRVRRWMGTTDLSERP